MAWEKTFIHSGVYMTTKTRKADKAAAFLQIAKFSLNAKSYVKNPAIHTRCVLLFRTLQGSQVI